MKKMKKLVVGTAMAGVLLAPQVLSTVNGFTALCVQVVQADDSVLKASVNWNQSTDNSKEIPLSDGNAILMYGNSGTVNFTYLIKVGDEQGSMTTSTTLDVSTNGTKTVTINPTVPDSPVKTVVLTVNVTGNIDKKVTIADPSNFQLIENDTVLTATVSPSTITTVYDSSGAEITYSSGSTSTSTEAYLEFVRPLVSGETLYVVSTSKLDESVVSNRIAFIYKGQTVATQYSVRGVDADGKVLYSKSVTGNIGDIISVKAQAVDGYSLSTSVGTVNVTLTSNTAPIVFQYTKKVVIYRAYNRNDGDHLYTASKDEFNKVIAAGWINEGIAWSAASKGSAIYRLYNPNSGEHFYTANVTEYNNVAAAGWNKEGIAFYSADSKEVNVYRLFNPNATGPGSHHYTTSEREVATLVSAGWKNENTAFYGLK